MQRTQQKSAELDILEFLNSSNFLSLQPWRGQRNPYLHVPFFLHFVPVYQSWFGVSIVYLFLISCFVQSVFLLILLLVRMKYKQSNNKS